MFRRSLAVVLVLSLAAGAVAQGDSSRVQPPIATQDVEVEASGSSLVLEDGSASVVTSATGGSLTVWEERTRCFDDNDDSCLNSDSQTSRTSNQIESASVTVQPRTDHDHVSVLQAEDGTTSLKASAAAIDVRPEAHTVELTTDEDAPEDLREVQIDRGANVSADEAELSADGQLVLRTVDSVVQVQGDNASEPTERIVTGVTWEQTDDGFYERTLRIAQVQVDGVLSAAWDGSVELHPQLPAPVTAGQATVNVTEGEIGPANATTGSTDVGDLEATVTGVAWQQDGTGQLVVQQGTQPVAQPDEPEQAGEPVSTTTVLGAGSVAALGALLAAYYWPRLSWLGASLLAPLYSRIEKDELFENEIREELYEEIQDDPGVHAHALSEMLDIGWGTTVYHLRRLERNGFVQSEKRGRYRRFFPESGFMERQREVLSVLQNETTNDIAEIVREQPGLNQSAICDELDISPSLANWHLNRLIDADLVDRERRGRTVHYTPGEAWDLLEQAVDVDASEIPGDAQAA